MRASHFGLADQSLVLTFPITAALSATALTTEGMDKRATMADTSLLALVWQFSDAPVRFRVGRRRNRGPCLVPWRTEPSGTSRRERRSRA